MADNTTLNPITTTGGDVIATDDILGVKYQRVKAVWGADGTANDTDDVAGKRLPIKLSQVTATGSLKITVSGSLPAGTNNIGKVTVTGGKVIVGVSGPLPAGSANIGKVTVSGAVNVTGGPLQIQGRAAHDAAIVGNPLPVGGRSRRTQPTAVTTGDVSHAWMDLTGRIIVVMNVPAANAGTSRGPKTTQVTGIGYIALATAPGAGNSIYVSGVAFSNNSGTKTVADIAGGTTNHWPMSLAPCGGGYTFKFDPPWKLPVNTALQGRVRTAVNAVFANVHFFVGAT